MTYLTPSDTAMYRKGIQAQYGLSYGIACLFDSFFDRFLKAQPLLENRCILRRYCTSYLKISIVVLYLKIIKTFLINNVSILKLIF